MTGLGGAHDLQELVRQYVLIKRYLPIEQSDVSAQQATARLVA
jgi:hypothetical protein